MRIRTHFAIFAAGMPATPALLFSQVDSKMPIDIYLEELRPRKAGDWPRPRPARPTR